MAIKKRVSLRSKSAKSTTTSKTAKSNAIAPVASGPVPYLLQARASKNQKLNEKQRSFASKIIGTQERVISSDPSQPGISKSAIRRRKRKLRDQLKPKLNDLMDALGDVVPDNTVEKDDDNMQEEEDQAVKVKLDHTPNPHKNLNSANKIEKEEIKRFGGVLKDESFRKNPFEALKEAIRNNSTKY